MKQIETNVTPVPISLNPYIESYVERVGWTKVSNNSTANVWEKADDLVTVPLKDSNTHSLHRGLCVAILAAKAGKKLKDFIDDLLGR